MSANVQKTMNIPPYYYLCFDRKLTEKPYYPLPQITNIPHYDSDHTLHIYPQMQSDF